MFVLLNNLDKEIHQLKVYDLESSFYQLEIYRHYLHLYLQIFLHNNQKLLESLLMVPID